MPLESMILCDCDRRYIQSSTPHTEPEQGSVSCKCGRTLGSWDGPYRLSFEPEVTDDDAH